VKAVVVSGRGAGKVTRWAAELTARGYRRTSRAHGLLARCDRPDWRDAMAATHPAGMAWVEALERQGHAAEQYRRCHTRDRLTVSRAVAQKVPSSDRDRTGFVP
jgi:hypothetical protein